MTMDADGNEHRYLTEEQMVLAVLNAMREGGESHAGGVAADLAEEHSPSWLTVGRLIFKAKEALKKEAG